MNSNTMINEKIYSFAFLFISIVFLTVAVEGGPAAYGTCQAGCAAAAGIAMCMSAGVCSIGCAGAYSACQSACALAAFAPTP